MPILRVSSATSDHVIGSYGSTVLHVLRRTAQLEGIGLISAETDVARTEAGALTLLGIIEAEAEVPEADNRSKLSDLLREFGEKGGVASALTFEGRGFRAATVRSLATGLAIVARQPYPHRIFATVPEAVRWLVTTAAQSHATPIDPQALIDAIETLRKS